MYNETTTEGARMVRRRAAKIDMRTIESRPQRKSQPRICGNIKGKPARNMQVPNGLRSYFVTNTGCLALVMRPWAHTGFVFLSEVAGAC